MDDLTSVVRSNYSVHALTFCDMNKIEAYDLQDIFDMYPEFTENFKKKFSLTFNLRMVCQDKSVFVFLRQFLLSLEC